MTDPPTEQQLATFRSWVLNNLGLSFDGDQSNLLAEVLSRRSRHGQVDPDSYLQALSGGDDREKRMLATELTVGETYFFRHREQMAAYLNQALGWSQMRPVRPLRVLSAGCSTGEEVYSLVMLARQAGLSPSETSFLALDVNPVVIKKARAGSYSGWSLRETPQELRDRWFRRDGSRYLLDPEIVASVEFSECNLLSSTNQLCQSYSFDVIFCRNLLMYLGPHQAQAVVARLESSLVLGGYLFLGHAESLRGLSERLQVMNTHGCFYYRRGDGPATPLTAGPTISGPLSPDWAEAIQAASERIEQIGLTGRQTIRPAPTSPDLGRIRELHESERYAEALEVLRRLPSDTRELPEAVLLQAVLAVQLSDFQDAEASCRRLLEGANFAAGAHYLLALCREGRGEREAAVAEHSAAITLDPGFAMPRLHLGLLARRARDLPTARKELARALLLLQSEDLPRLRLFGGGFGREALVELCRSELRSCEVSR